MNVSSFVSVLKKVGQVILFAEGLEKVYKPFLQIIPGEAKVADKLDLLTKLVVDAEVMGQAIQAPGSQKAAMLAPAAFQLLLDLPILQGKKPKDPAQAKLDAAAVGAAVAKFLNNFEG